jgi:hypothetical protein
MNLKIKYKEGTWFGIPLEGGGYGVGVAARAKRHIVLAYFFGPRRETLPRLDEISKLKPSVAVTVLRVGDLGLVRGEWPIIGNDPSWNRSEWPMPIFIRYEPITLRKWLVFYSDLDPGKRLEEVLEPNDRPDLPRDSLSGSGAAEFELTQLLSGPRKS